MADAGTITVGAKLVLDKASASNLGKEAGEAVKKGQEQAQQAAGPSQGVRDQIKAIRPNSFLDKDALKERERRLGELLDQRAAGLRGYNVQSFFRKPVQPSPFNPQTGLATTPVMPSAPLVPYGGPPPPKLPKIPTPPTPGTWSGGGMGGASAVAAGAAAAGIPGAGLIVRAMASPIGLAFVAVGLQLMAFKKALAEVTEAIKNAKAIYAKQLTSGGMPTGLTVGKNLLARMLGVGEDDVLQFGIAIQTMGQKLQHATNVLTDTNRTLTYTAWTSSVMKADVNAMWASVAEAMAPAMNLIYETVSAIAKFAVDSGIASAIGNGLSGLVKTMTLVLQSQVLFIASWIEMMLKVSDALQITSGSAEEFADSVNTMDKGFKNAWVESSQVRKAPSATSMASARRYESSPWERMGLVVGVGGGTNYPAMTARNTAKTASAVEKVAQLLIPRTGAPVFSTAHSMP